jgi:hypothetical protein
LAAALGTAPLTAQEPTTELTGCHDIIVGDWYVLLYGEEGPDAPLMHEGGDSLDFELPSRIEFAGPRWPTDTESPTLIVVPPGALPSIHHHRIARFAGHSLRMSFGTGYSGLDIRLARSGEGWSGIATTLMHIGGVQVNARTVKLIPASCDSPPPVSIDAMRPLARSVELEGGSVITLDRPLPESVAIEAFPDQPDRFNVAGRTTALFGSTDSIQIEMGKTRSSPDVEVVGDIKLFYPADHFAALAARLRDVFGAPTPGTEFAWHNRITRMYLNAVSRDGGRGFALLQLGLY